MNLLSQLARTGRHPTSPSPADAPLGLARQRLLADALLQAQRGAESTHDLRLDLPPPGDVRIRNLVHRGAPRPVFKTTSVKLGRVVQCESALEHEAALLLDVSPVVNAFAEQPVRIHYLFENGWRSHIPDFAVLVADQLTFVEIKFEKDVATEVRDRTRSLEWQLGALGVGYRLLTERDLREGYYVQNALRVLRRARHAISKVQLLATLEKLRAVDRVPLAAFGWSVADSQEAVGIAQLIMSGHAAIDPHAPLSDRTCVWLARDTVCAGGVA
jgi:hypothetical protein